MFGNIDGAFRSLDHDRGTDEWVRFTRILVARSGSWYMGSSWSQFRSYLHVSNVWGFFLVFLCCSFCFVLGMRVIGFIVNGY